MRNLLASLLLTFFCYVHPSAQVNLLQKSLTDLHVTINGISRVVMQPDGKTVALGSITEGRSYKTALLRFDSTGNLDKTFGKNGIDTFNTDGFFPGYDLAFFDAIALQGDKIVIGGAAEFFSNVSQGNAVLMRFTSSGIIDSSFGYNGITVTNTTSGTGISIDEIQSIAVDGADRICVTGRTYDYTKYRFLVARYKQNGQLDATFANGGTGVFDIGTEDDEALDIKVRAGNNLLVLGKTYTTRANYEVALLGLKSDGSPDPSFGENGTAVTLISAGSDIAYTMAIQPDRRIVCVGASGNNLLALRFKPGGTPDSSFGKSGRVIMPVGDGGVLANGIAIQPSGAIVVGGYVKKGGYSQFFTARLLKSGNIDSSYARSGFLYNSLFGAADMANGMTQTQDGRIIQAGQATRAAATLMCLERYTVDGRLDYSFGNKGVKAFGIGSSKDVAFKMVKLPWDNSFLLCGTANQYWSLVKYGPHKSLEVDKNFGVNGVVSVPYQNQTDQFSEPNVAVDSALKRIYMCAIDGYDFMLFCFKSDGSVDTTFGQKGVVHYPHMYLYYGGLAVTPKHKIIFPGIKFQGVGEGNFIAAYTPSGVPDSSFGVNGELDNLGQYYQAVMPDNRNGTIKLAGSVPVDAIFDNGICVLSITENGNTDASFGQNGVAVLPIPNGSTEPFFKYCMTEDAYGRIIVNGSVQLYDSFGYFFALARFTKNGQVDAGFGKNGLVITSPGDPFKNNPSNEGVAVGSVDKKHYYIVTAGTEMDSYFITAKSVVCVFKENGKPDTLVTSTLYWDQPLFGGTFESAYGAYIDDVTTFGYNLYIAGTGGRGGTQDFGLARLNKFNQTISMHSGSIDYSKGAGFSIFPNPVQNSFTISCMLSSAGPVNVDLLDINGKVIKQYNFANSEAGQFRQTLLLPPGLSAGLYFVKLTTAMGSITQKLVKQ